MTDYTGWTVKRDDDEEGFVLLASPIGEVHRVRFAEHVILEQQAEIERLRSLVRRIDETLCVPAAEYVPAIRDVFTIIDESMKTRA